MSRRRRVVVVGGGITGLAAAHALVTGADSAGVDLDGEVHEASGRAGGCLLTSEVDGLRIDAGPDAFLARVPGARELAVAVGLGDQLVAPRASGARVWSRGRMRPLPPGLTLGIPGDVVAVARSGLLSPLGLARAALEPLLPRRDPGDNLGRLVRARFGGQVLERLVDPLLGGVYAGDADAMSLAAATPQIADLATRHRSMLVAARRNRPPAPAPGSVPPPVFLTPRDGLGALVDAVVAALPAPTLRCASPVATLAEVTADADAVVLAAPADVTAGLLAPAAPAAARLLSDIPQVSVALVTLVVPVGDLPAWARPDADPAVSGWLVPKPEQRTITACSLGSSKWAHWQDPAGERAVLRVSVGRMGDERALALADDDLVARVLDDLATHLGRRPSVRAVRVARWRRAFPQYAPGHPDRVRRVDAEVADRLPRVVTAGAWRSGVGIPACIRDGQRAARAVLDALGGAGTGTGPGTGSA